MKTTFAIFGCLAMLLFAARDGKLLAQKEEPTKDDREVKKSNGEPPAKAGKSVAAALSSGLKLAQTAVSKSTTNAGATRISSSWRGEKSNSCESIRIV